MTAQSEMRSRAGTASGSIDAAIVTRWVRRAIGALAAFGVLWCVGWIGLTIASGNFHAVKPGAVY